MATFTEAAELTRLLIGAPRYATISVLFATESVENSRNPLIVATPYQLTTNLFTSEAVNRSRESIVVGEYYTRLTELHTESSDQIINHIGKLHESDTAITIQHGNLEFRRPPIDTTLAILRERNPLIVSNELEVTLSYGIGATYRFGFEPLVTGLKVVDILNLTDAE